MAYGSAGGRAGLSRCIGAQRGRGEGGESKREKGEEIADVTGAKPCDSFPVLWLVGGL